MHSELLSSVLTKLTGEAERCFASDSSAEQAVVVLTAKDNLYRCANHGVTSGSAGSEGALANQLEKNNDTEVKYAICMWRHDFAGEVSIWPWPLEVPSWRLREQLKQINPLNGDAVFFLQTEGGYCVRTLKEMEPPGK